MLSIIINTKNSAATLEACLKSIQPLIHQTNGEIVLVDMHSQDNTIAIAKQFQARIYQHEDVGFADPAREYAFSKAKFDWLMIIDSDETATPELIDQIREIVDDEAPINLQGDCFYIPRYNKIFNHYLDHTLWYPDFQLRLWRRGSIEWIPEVHTQPKIKGKVCYFPDNKKLAFRHDNYRTVGDYWQRTDKYTTFQAKKIITEYKTTVKEGKATTTELDFSSKAFFDRFFSEFNRRFFAGQGYLDGNHGLVLSLLQATAETATLTKIWQTTKFTHQEFKAEDTDQLLANWQKEIAYHRADFNLKQQKLNFFSQKYWQVRRKFKI